MIDMDGVYIHKLKFSYSDYSLNNIYSYQIESDIVCIHNYINNIIVIILLYCLSTYVDPKQCIYYYYL